MALLILHDLNDDEVMVNTDNLTAAKRREPDEHAVIKVAFTKLYYVSKDKTMDAMGFPDTVKETPAEIAALAAKK